MKIRSLAIASLFVLSAASAFAATITENFSTNPLQHGWQIFGDTNLFQWDSANQNLAVTWDSSQTNSYFYHPLGATFTKADSFCVLFDLNLTDVNAKTIFNLPWAFAISPTPPAPIFPARTAIRPICLNSIIFLTAR